MNSMTRTTNGNGTRQSDDDLVVDVRGLTAQQRQHVDVTSRAIVAGLLPADEMARLMATGTAAEIAEEAARRLAVTR